MVQRSAVLISLLLLGGCERPTGPQPGGNDQPNVTEDPAPDRLRELTGLFQSSAESRLCIVESRFGLVIRLTEGSGCGGSGRVVREAGGVRFTMQGDSSCSFVARVAGQSLVFPAALPAGCGYYCGEGATLAGVRLTQSGSGRGEALKARDLAGDSLCEDE